MSNCSNAFNLDEYGITFQHFPSYYPKPVNCILRITELSGREMAVGLFDNFVSEDCRYFPYHPNHLSELSKYQCRYDNLEIRFENSTRIASRICGCKTLPDFNDPGIPENMLSADEWADVYANKIEIVWKTDRLINDKGFKLELLTCTYNLSVIYIKAIP